jgi:hypothetical protein
MYDSEALFLEPAKSILFVDFLLGYSHLILYSRLIFLTLQERKRKRRKSVCLQMVNLPVLSDIYLSIYKKNYGSHFV